MIVSDKPTFTPEATIGPFFPFRFTDGSEWQALPAPGTGRRADGAPVALTGRILDCHGIGIRNMIVESWQANAHGRYRHPDDGHSDHQGDAPLDPAFDGFARVRTDADGGFRIATIKPGAHPAVSGNAMRAPHLRLTVFGSGIDRLVTFAYFDDEPANPADPLLASLAEPDRGRLVARRSPAEDADGFAAYRLDIVLRGDAETPFFDDWQE
ncbi:protocatechuate 3,4-dioxygenase subunit alpha [Thalassobaculum sp.]|uniref:protocatechuate 3,4-dioxygenase subunit alpha n=1 Tax=Thalassobaculum sp. TaxID=2022740 RepID=UPI0032EAE07E